MGKAASDEKLIREVVDQVSKMSLEDITQDLEMMGIDDIAGKLKLGRSTTYHLANKGLLPAVKFGTSVRIRPRALYACILIKEKLGLAA